MTWVKYITLGLGVLLAIGLLNWLGRLPDLTVADQGKSPSTQPVAPLRIGLVPERDIFAQRQRYASLATYLQSQLGQPVEIVTLRSYRDVLQELRDRRVEAAFLGSLVTVLAVDELKVQILVRPELPGGVSTYRGVIFVKPESNVQAIADLTGRSIAMVPTTTAAALFPVSEFVRRKMVGTNRPQTVFAGTHDDVILEVLDGRADAGAVKDLRLNEYEKDHPDTHFRRLATSDAVPENALVVRADLPGEFIDRVESMMLSMHQTGEGKTALTKFGATKFIRSVSADYRPIYDMIDRVGSEWAQVDSMHLAPRSPQSSNVESAH